MFSDSLGWRQRSREMAKDFPQFHDLLVAVVEAQEPEQADATAQALQQKLAADTQHFLSARRPDASPFFDKAGLLFLDQKATDGADRTRRWTPAIPWPTGGRSVGPRPVRRTVLAGDRCNEGQADLTPYLKPIEGFHKAMASALDGNPRPLSWQSLFGGGLGDLAGPDQSVLAQPKQDFGSFGTGRRGDGGHAGGDRGSGVVKAGTARVENHRPGRCRG